MPPAVAAAAVAAAGTATSAALNSAAAGRAARGQQKSTAGAMRMQREERQAADRRYERDYSAWQAQQNQRNAILNAVLSRYGVNVGGGGASAAGTPAGFGASLGSLMGGGSGGGANLMDSQAAGSFPAGPQNFAPPATPELVPTPQPSAPESLGDLGNWNDWRNYGSR